MINSNFALGTWEIHLQSNEEKNYIVSQLKNICKYIDTAIDYNNDYIIKDIINNNNFILISKISSYHNDNYEFFVQNHLKCLNRDYIDIMLIHSNRGNWQDLALKMKDDNRFKEIGVSNFNINDLKEYKDLVGYYPLYNELEINPYYTDLDTINFCKDNNIKVISYGIFGGKYNAMTNIADFSEPYLISYASKLADIVIIKPESYRQTNEFVDVIENYDNSNDNIKINNNTNVDYKGIEPMRYFAKDVIKLCNNYPTYNNSCGHNINITKYIKEDITNEIPSFEMLGDFQTYIRYKYRTIYTNNEVYYYDFLIGDDGNFYVVYLYDENDKLTKINVNNKYKIYKLIKL